MTAALRFEEAARIYAERGIAAHPLKKDPEGFAKQPLFEDGGAWLRFTTDDNVVHPWGNAEGIGLILGAPSGNLAVADIDDPGLAEGIKRFLLAHPSPPLMANTPHKNLHIYVVEPEPSTPVDIEGRWQNRWAKVQLLSKTRQVAAPPTPGYSWVNSTAEPAYGSLPGYWHKLALEMNIYYRMARHYTNSERDWSRKLP